MATERVSNVDQLAYVQPQAADNIIPNTGGAATLADGDAVRISTISLTNEQDLIDTANKTGTLSLDASVAGRLRAPFDVAMDLNPNGTPGGLPDSAPLIDSAFGQAAVSISGTVPVIGAADNGSGAIRITATAHGLSDDDVVTISGVVGTIEANNAWLVAVIDANTFDLLGSTFTNTYTSGGTVTKTSQRWSISPNLPGTRLPVVIWDFVGVATAEQQVAVNCIPNSVVWELGNDILTQRFTGTGGWVLLSHDFANAGAKERGGLTAFPTQPTNPTLTGGIITGFTGMVVADGLNLASISQATVTFNTGAQLDENNWNDNLPEGHEFERRRVTVDLTLKDTTGPEIENLKQKARRAVPLDVFLLSGDQAGNRFAWLLKSVQFSPHTRSDGERSMDVSISGVAHASSVGAVDEISMWAL